MQRLLTSVATCLISAAMAFGQGTSGQSTPTTGTSPNGNATTPSKTSSTPSSPNQALPGDANPGTAAAKDGRANGQAVRPDQSSNSASGSAPGNTPNNVQRPSDDASTNPSRTRDADTSPRGGGVPWFWVTLGIIVGIVLIGALMSRGRVVDTMDTTDPGLRTRRDDIARRDDQIRRAG